MRWSGIILGLVFATHAFAQQIQSTEADLRKKNRDFLFEAAEQTTPTLRAYIRENGSAYTSVSNLGAIFYFSSNATDEVGMAVTNTSSGLDYLEWTLTSDQTAVPGEYFAQIIVTNTTGSIQEWIRGEFDILDSPGTTAVNSWAWNSSNYATVAWVEAQIAAVEASITGMVERSVFDATNAITIAALEVLSTGKVSIAAWQGSNLVLQAGITANADAIGVLQTAKVDITSWQSSNAVLQAGIDAAQGMATMGGDVSGPSTNAAVVKIRSVPVSELLPGLEEDGYGLKYDHATGSLLLGPVATEGTSISNILILSDVAASTDVSISEVGAYRILRPGNLPSMVLNVGGYETAYFDLLGLTLKAGSLHLLSDVLAVNPAAYDGSVTAPAYTWGDDRDLGKYRFSYNGDYAEGFTVQSNRVWYWAADGIHLESGKQFFGLDYSWLANTPDLSNTGNWDTAYGWGDHSIVGYILANGSVAWTGSQNAGGQSITNLGAVSGNTGSFQFYNIDASGLTTLGKSGSSAYFALYGTNFPTAVKGDAFLYVNDEFYVMFGASTNQYDFTPSAMSPKYSSSMSLGSSSQRWANVHASTAIVDVVEIGGVGFIQDILGSLDISTTGSMFAVSMDEVSQVATLLASSGKKWQVGSDGATGADIMNYRTTVTLTAPQSSTNDAPTLITPRWVGDELAIYGATQVIYRAFGITTNDWSQTWP